jgi:hypothetical protein
VVLYGFEIRRGTQSEGVKEVLRATSGPRRKVTGIWRNNIIF